MSVDALKRIWSVHVDQYRASPARPARTSSVQLGHFGGELASVLERVIRASRSRFSC